MSDKKTRSPLQVTGNSKPQNEKILKAGCLNWYSVFFVAHPGDEPGSLGYEPNDLPLCFIKKNKGNRLLDR